MMIPRSLFSLMILWVCAAAGNQLCADTHSMETLYGEGVYAFGSKDYAKAIQIFDSMKSQASSDPRAYFYCGLAQYRSGNQTAAMTDFAQGATLELSQQGRAYSVPKSLEKIQGRERLIIEQVRRQAKKKWENEESLRRKNEFEQQRNRDRLIYDGIIERGRSPQHNVEGGVTPPASVPFGAKAINPFNLTVDSSPMTPLDRTIEFTDDNMFKSDIERKIVAPQAKRIPRGIIIPKRPPKNQDNEDGVGDDVEAPSEWNFEEDGEYNFDAGSSDFEDPFGDMP